MKTKTILILLLAIFSINTHAAKPSLTSCDYYYDVEDMYRCGKEGYPLQFGYRLCEMYRKEQPNLTPAIQKWFPKIRYCLQKYIELDRGSIRDCDDLKQKAIDSHIQCYVHTGFCSLSEVDLLHIIRVTSTELLDLDIMGMSFKVMNECRKVKK